VKLRGKFILAFLICGFTPLLLGSFFSHYIATRALIDVVGKARDALEDTAKGRLHALMDAKQAQLEDFAETIRSEALTIASVRLLGMAIKNMGPSFSRLAEDYELSTEQLAEQRRKLYGYYDTVFRDQFRKANDGREPDIQTYLDAMSDNTVAAQYRFLIENHKPELHEMRPPPRTPREASYEHEFAQMDNFSSTAIQRLGFHDMLLVDGASGNIVYSSARGVDFGVSLKSSPLAESALGKSFNEVMATGGTETVVFSDYAPYFPVHGAACSFLVVPVYTGEELVGAVIFRLNLDRLNRIMSVQAGLGKEGAMLLVGHDSLLRSNVPGDTTGQWNVRSAFLRPENSRVMLEPVKKALFGRKIGIDVTKDFRDGREALVAYAPIEMMGAPWVLLAIMKTEEAYASVSRMEENAKNFTEWMTWASNILANLAIIVLSAVAYYFARRISRPLLNTNMLLKDMARGQGDRTRRLAVYGNDEVGELARAFNEFMDKLEGIYQSLEREVAERKQAELEVQKREAYFKTLIEYAPDVILIVNEDYSTSYVSPSYQRTFGYTFDELRDKDPLFFVHPDDHEKLHTNMRLSMENPGAPRALEMRLLHKNGEWRWVGVTATNQLHDGVVNGVVLNVRDVTERKHAELVLLQYNENLEREVAERTMELRKKTDDLAKALNDLRATQDKLVLNEKMASLGALTAGIAHEIKNPLNFVNNFSDLSGELVSELRQEIELLKAPGGKADFGLIDELLTDIQGNVKKIMEHGKRADSIVRSMLLHSRGVSGQKQLTDINALLDEYVHLTYHGMRAQDSTFNIAFDLEYDPTIEEIEVVPQDISRVFLNVLNNACYATHEQAKTNKKYQPKLTVRSYNRGDWVELRIKDNGPGIPEDIRRDIFTPFFTTKPAGKGTGLGLSISYDIVVKEHQGEIVVDSKPGEFTEFVITLPKRDRSDNLDYDL